MRAVYGLAARLAPPPPWPSPSPSTRPYEPELYTETSYRGTIAGWFGATPSGVILHGSRSGIAGYPTAQEFYATCHWAAVEPDGLGWNATIGDDVLGLHMPMGAWGWNARGCSSHYLAVEFAQATAAAPISDAQVRAFCYFFATARGHWPALPRYLPTHAELDGSPMYGPYDGKTDVFPRDDPRTVELRTRIAVRLDELGM